MSKFKEYLEAVNLVEDLEKLKQLSLKDTKNFWINKLKLKDSKRITIGTQIPGVWVNIQMLKIKNIPTAECLISYSKDLKDKNFTIYNYGYDEKEDMSFLIKEYNVKSLQKCIEKTKEILTKYYEK